MDSVPHDYRVGETPVQGVADDGVKIPPGQEPTGPHQTAKSRHAPEFTALNLINEEDHGQAKGEMSHLVHIRTLGSPEKIKGQAGLGTAKHQEDKTPKNLGQAAIHDTWSPCNYYWLTG